MTFYVSIQTLDYDDYPVGNDQKIGWFHTQDDAEDWVMNSGLFHKEHIFGNLFEYKQNDLRMKHTVSIRNILDTRVTSPHQFEKAR